MIGSSSASAALRFYRPHPSSIRRRFHHRALALLALTNSGRLGGTSSATFLEAAAAAATNPLSTPSLSSTAFIATPLRATVTSLRAGSSSSSPLHATTTMSATSLSTGPSDAKYSPHTELTFDSSGTTITTDKFDATVIIGLKSDLTTDSLKSILLSGGNDDASDDDKISTSIIDAALNSISGKSGTTSTFLPVQNSIHKVGIIALPDTVTRNNHPMSVHTITESLSKVIPEKGDVRVMILMTKSDNNGGEETEVGSLAIAVAKSFPLYSRKTSSSDETTKSDGDDKRTVCVTFLDGTTYQPVTNESYVRAAEASAEGVRLACRLVDCPPEELTTEAFSNEARAVAKILGSEVTFEEIVGDELKVKGYGGIHGVGRAAVCPPRLVMLTYRPKDDGEKKEVENIALVGKGIVYDTGGLSLKPKTGMCGMKHDMGGAAGLLGGFYAAVKMKTSQRLTLLLCLAENAIGPSAFRNDDILTMYSGKTVEVNNCDAEGRLVLADGVAHATRHIDGLNLVIDMATLTGAQLVATGKKHGGILANTAELEQRAVKAGMKSGDLVFPLLYAPELLKSEFKSEVADMKNSVKDRSNAQTSCAGHFIEDHLNKEYEGGWLHVDMAGPAVKGERATGYGVGLILSLLGVSGF